VPGTFLERRGGKIQGVQVHKLIEKFEAPVVENTDDEGLVAIEYVVGAGLVAAGVAVVFATGLWTKMQTKLTSLF
jgi:hypothetical protein